MNWLRPLVLSVAFVATAVPAFASRPPPPWYRPPLGIETYAFLGEITPSVLRDGEWVASPLAVPDGWAGGRIRGTLSLNLDEAEGGLGGPGQMAWSDGKPEHDRHGNWLDVRIVNPDGSVLEVPAPTPNAPLPGPTNRGTLVADTGENVFGPNYGGSLNVARTFSDSAGSLSQSFRLDLASVLGAGGSPVWFDSTAANYLGVTLEVDASRADFTNAGFVSHVDANGQSYQYGFTLLRVVHMPPVPEPATLALVATGVALVGWRVRRRAGAAPTAAGRAPAAVGAWPVRC